VFSVGKALLNWDNVALQEEDKKKKERKKKQHDMIGLE